MSEILDEFMDCMFHCDTVCVSLEGIGATNFETREIHPAIQALIAENEELKKKLEEYEKFENDLKLIDFANGG